MSSHGKPEFGSNKESFNNTSNNNLGTFTSVPQEEAVSLPNRFSAREIDVNLINKSLANVNNFTARRQNEKTATILMYEIQSNGESDYKEMTLRELLNYVNQEANAIDLAAQQREDLISAQKNRKFSLSTIFGSIDDIDVKPVESSVPFMVPLPVQASTFEDHSPSSVRSVPNPPPASNNQTRASVTFKSGGATGGIAGAGATAGTLYGNGNGGAGGEETFSAVSELRLRDLRRLDFQFNPNEEKSVLIRRHAVLFAMDPMRAVVMTNRLILIVPTGADSLISILDKYMKEWNPKMNNASNENLHTNFNNASFMQQKYSIPFEAHAYEALITTVKSMESQEFDNVTQTLQDILRYCSHGSLLPIEVQEKMRNLKNDLAMMMARVTSSQNALHELTEDDEEMALMNLTYLKNKPKLYAYPLVSEIVSKHDEIEELLESYLLDFNALSGKIDNARSQIQSAEELVSLRLDTSRNELLIANTALAVLACSIGFSAYITGAFGMNLDNVDSIQPVKGVFFGVFGATFILIPIVFVMILGYLKYSKMLPNGLTFQ